MSEIVDVTWEAGKVYRVTVVDGQPEPQPGTDPPFTVLTMFSQNDDRWQAEEYAPGWKFGSYGCLVTCVAMMTSLVYAEAFNPPDTAHQLRQAGCFVGGLLSRPHRITQAFERLQWGGYLHWRDVPARLSVLAEEIAAYGATIIEVNWDPTDLRRPEQGNQHFVLATQVTTQIAPADVVIVDPWDGQEKLLSLSRYAQPLGWTAARAIYGVRLVRPKAEAEIPFP